MTEEEKKQETQVEGFALSGEEVESMKDKHFQIDALPSYREFENRDDKTKPKDRRLMCPVQMANGIRADWYPNNKCVKVILASKGRDYSNWVGFTAEMKVVEKDVFGTIRKVIYLVVE